MFTVSVQLNHTKHPVFLSKSNSFKHVFYFKNVEVCHYKNKLWIICRLHLELFYWGNNAGGKYVKASTHKTNYLREVCVNCEPWSALGWASCTELNWSEFINPKATLYFLHRSIITQQILVDLICTRTDALTETQRPTCSQHGHVRETEYKKLLHVCCLLSAVRGLVCHFRRVCVCVCSLSGWRVIVWVVIGSYVWGTLWDVVLKRDETERAGKVGNSPNISPL